MRCLSLSFVCLAVVYCANASFIQNANGQEPEKATAEGKIKEIRGNMLHVVGDDGSQWFIKPASENVRIGYYATASRDALKPGMFVRLKADFDARGKAASEAAEVVVFPAPEQPREANRRRPPANAEEWARQQQNLKRQRERDAENPNRIGIFPESSINTEALFQSPDEKNTKPATKRFRVAGRVTGVRNGVVAIQAGTASVAVPVAAETSVSVELDTAQFAKAGDSVVVEGWAIPGQPSQIAASFIRINAAQAAADPAKPDAAVQK